MMKKSDLQHMGNEKFDKYWRLCTWKQTEKRLIDYVYIVLNQRISEDGNQIGNLINVKI